jgi:Uma2 family endonuclease
LDEVVATSSDEVVATSAEARLAAPAPASYARGRSTALKRPTVEDYFATDLSDDRKYEFVDGEIIAMAGGDPVHSLLAATLTQLLKNRLAGAPCLTFQSDLRVRIGDAGDDDVYPDATVACPPRTFLDTRPRTLATPTVVFEVLSPSTAAHDQGTKAAAYRRTASLQEYVLIDSETRHVLHAVRLDAHTFTVRDHVGDESFTLPALGIELSLAALYEGFESLRDELRADVAPAGGGE